MRAVAKDDRRRENMIRRWRMVRRSPRGPHRMGTSEERKTSPYDRKGDHTRSANCQDANQVG